MSVPLANPPWNTSGIYPKCLLGICKAPVGDSNPFLNQPPTSAIGRLLRINLNYAN
uniref:Uncharacterized protein n=1 Tax=Enterococcus phage PMBT56 TaxID=3229530 RepID=A0AB39C6I5_9CAUD